jgi:hypothetical protein
MMGSLSDERGRMLAVDIERKLKETIRQFCGRDIIVRVRYMFGGAWEYRMPWADAGPRADN